MLTEKDYCGQNIEDLLAEVGFPIRDYQFSLQGPGVLIKENVSLYDAQKFLREEKSMNVNIRAFIENGWYYTIQDCKGNPICSQLTLTEELYSTYEEALSEGLRTAIKILKGE